jgi:hypothetical protein
MNRIRSKRSDLKLWHWIASKRHGGHSDSAILSALQWLELSIDQRRNIDAKKFLDVELIAQEREQSCQNGEVYG